MVRCGDTDSRPTRFFNGVPQGSVCGPLLWIIYISGLEEVVKRANDSYAEDFPDDPSPTTKVFQNSQTSVVAYADDLTFLITGPNVFVLRRQMNYVLDKVGKYLVSLDLTISEKKLQAILFHNHNGAAQDETPLSINGMNIPWKPELTLLGFVFNKKFTASPQVRKICTKARLRLTQMRIVASTKWGMDPIQLRTVYVQYILSVILYAAAIWYPRCSATDIKMLSSLHLEAGRIITQLLKSTERTAILLEADFVPLALLLQSKTALAAEKCCRAEPMSLMSKMANETRAKTRLAKKSWMIQSDLILLYVKLRTVRVPVLAVAEPEWELPALPLLDPIPEDMAPPVVIPEVVLEPPGCQNPRIIPLPENLIDATNRDLSPTHSSVPPWDTQLISDRVSIAPSLLAAPKDVTAAELAAHRLRVSMEAIAPRLMDTRYYTDASVYENDILSGALCRFRPNLPDAEPTVSIRYGVGRLGSSFAGESCTIMKCLNSHYQGMAVATPVSLFSDSQSTLKALAKGPFRPKHSTIDGIWDAIYRGLKVFAGGPLHLGFCYSHVGVPGNTHADAEATGAMTQIREGTLSNVAPIMLDGVKCHLRKHLRSRWLESILGHQTRRVRLGKSPFPRYLICGTLHGNLKSPDLSHEEAVLIRQLRSGECYEIGKYPSRIGLAQSCRWCTGLEDNPAETVLHLFDDCLDPRVVMLRAEAVLSQVLMESSPSSLLWTNPRAALDFYSACKSLLEEPVVPMGDIVADLERIVVEDVADPAEGMDNVMDGIVADLEGIVVEDLPEDHDAEEEDGGDDIELEAVDEDDYAEYEQGIDNAMAGIVTDLETIEDFADTLRQMEIDDADDTYG